MAAKKTSKAKALRCPTCRAILLMSEPDFPFCSDYCRRIDLGKWASGAYVISSPILDPETAEEVESMRRQNNDDE
jgi:endogenous inhibitor of DNA gyrase (YacG/DUF329 family)